MVGYDFLLQAVNNTRQIHKDKNAHVRKRASISKYYLCGSHGDTCLDLLQEKSCEKHSWWTPSSCFIFGSITEFTLRPCDYQAIPSQRLSTVRVLEPRPLLSEVGFLWWESFGQQLSELSWLRFSHRGTMVWAGRRKNCQA